jgi:hypothetical protein
MKRSNRKAAELIRKRRLGNRKRSLSTAVAAVTKDATTRKTVTAALRKAAKPLRESGDLGRVQVRTCYVTPDQVGKNYRYTARQIARIAADYNPRKSECKAARAALLGV